MLDHAQHARRHSNEPCATTHSETTHSEHAIKHRRFSDDASATTHKVTTFEAIDKQLMANSTHGDDYATTASDDAMRRRTATTHK
jgi:hypothetical protein